jgi:predicted nucleic acid-binding protein
MATAAVDANVLVGLLDDHDKWHAASVALRDALNEAGVELVYFDCVINETVSVLARRTYEQGRPEQLDELLDKLDSHIPISDITWASGETRRLYSNIMSLIRSSSGKLNFHDALIALVCGEQEVSILVSFDRDFDEIDWLTRVAQASHVVGVCGRCFPNTSI